jgi:geranylgeranyl diphosphate synthase type II
MDDLLDVYAKTELFWKQVGGDIISNKKTYLLIKALELANGEDYRELNKWIEAKNFNKEEKVHAVKDLYSRLGIDTNTRDQIKFYFKRSLDEFSKVNVSEQRKSNLMALVTYLMNREK